VANVLDINVSLIGQQQCWVVIIDELLIMLPNNVVYSFSGLSVFADG